MVKEINPTLDSFNWTGDYVSVMELKITHVSKVGDMKD